METSLVYHGLQWPEYWQGQGTLYTSYNHVVTGYGDTPLEAIDEALDLLYEDLGECVAQAVLKEHETLIMEEIRDQYGNEPAASDVATEGEMPEYPCYIISILYNE